MAQHCPPPIRTDGSNAFARRSMARRVPGIFEDVLDRNPDYSTSIGDSVARLRDAIVDDEPMTMFSPPGPDYDYWAGRFSEHRGESWLGTEWFFAEMFAYRHLLDACRYWTTRRDPFRPFKAEEIQSEMLRETVGAALGEKAELRERLVRSLLNCLWGNRMDLSMTNVLEQGTAAKDEHLLANDLSAAADHLLSGATGDVHLIMDNAGTEEAFDLALTDLLLNEGVAETVTLHVKMAPVLVGDVMGEDIFWLLDVMEEYGSPLAPLTARIRTYVETGVVRIVPDLFWNTDGRMWELPPRLEVPFRMADLVIAKGDANYRRITNDAFWPPEAELEQALDDFPAPLLALRTLKSDTLVGVDEDIIGRLDEQERNWRTKGTYGVVQFANVRNETAT